MGKVRVKKEVSQTDLAYLAGIIDGEGCISLTKFKTTNKNRRKSASYNTTVRVNMVDPQVIYWIKDKVGGNVYVAPKSNWGRRKIFSWTIANSEATALLEKLLPYLRTKSKQAILVIHYRKHFIKKSRATSLGISAAEAKERENLAETNKLLNQGILPRWDNKIEEGMI